MKNSTIRNFKPMSSLSDAQIGLEARAQADDHLDVKVWLRLLACSTQIGQSVRHHLRMRFETTLARFDYMAQLERHPEGLRMHVLSRYLMVSDGNVTGLTDVLAQDGLVERISEPHDRRSRRVRLTAKGRSEFAAMAAEHERWLIELFQGVPLPIKQVLYERLGQLRAHLAHYQAEGESLTSDCCEKRITTRRT